MDVETLTAISLAATTLLVVFFIGFFIGANLDKIKHWILS